MPISNREQRGMPHALLAVTGKLNRTMFGRGYRDFDYEEAYAPIYTYKTADSPELWRRSVALDPRYGAAHYGLGLVAKERGAAVSNLRDLRLWIGGFNMQMFGRERVGEPVPLFGEGDLLGGRDPRLRRRA